MLLLYTVAKAQLIFIFYYIVFLIIAKSNDSMCNVFFLGSFSLF